METEIAGLEANVHTKMSGERVWHRYAFSEVLNEAGAQKHSTYKRSPQKDKD